MDEWTKNSGKSAVVMQMMKKMGYVHGRGLGSKQQGIVEPVSAKVRTGRTALGYQKDEQIEIESTFRVHSSKDEQLFGTFIDNDDTINSSVKQIWKKSTASKEKPRCKTLDDILDDEILYGGERKRLDPDVRPYGKIIDLTGPNEKVYEDFASYYEDSNSREGVQKSTSKLIDLTEKEIRKNGRELQFLKDQTCGLQQDRESLAREISLGRTEVLRMEEMMRIIQRSLPVLSTDSSALEECRVLFLLLKRDFPMEFKLFGVDSLLITNILPIIKSSFTRWMPGDPTAIETILPWKSVFTSSTMAEFLALTIVPKLERALQTVNIHTTEKFICLGIFEWTELVGSDFMCDMIFYASVCSKLSSPNVLLSSVKDYYANWKSLFPEHFLTTKTFRDELTRALVAINQVQSGSVLVPVSLPRSADRSGQGDRPHLTKKHFFY